MAKMDCTKTIKRGNSRTSTRTKPKRQKSCGFSRQANNGGPVRIHSEFREERENSKSGQLLFYRRPKECQLPNEIGYWGHSMLVVVTGLIQA